MMLKNENKYVYGVDDQKPPYTMLEQLMDHVTSFCERVYVADDSNDGSAAVYARYPEVVGKYRQPKPYDENKNLNMLLDRVRDNPANKWVLYLDGDEILENYGIDWIARLTEIVQSDTKCTVRFTYANLWRSRRRYRVDKLTGQSAGKLFTVHPDLRSFGSSYNDHHFSYGSLGNFGEVVETDLHIIHYGWVDWNHIIMKHARAIRYETELNGRSLAEAEAMHAMLLDEVGLVLRYCREDWPK